MSSRAEISLAKKREGSGHDVDTEEATDALAKTAGRAASDVPVTGVLDKAAAQRIRSLSQHVLVRASAVNYGVNKVGFPAAVPVGNRIRGHVRLVPARPKQTGLERAFGILVELEGSDRPACVIETIVIYR